MKSLSFKLPIHLSLEMEENNEMHGKNITQFLTFYHNMDFEPKPIQGLTMAHTYKIPDHIHKSLKLRAIDKDMTLSQYVCQLFHHYYTVGR